LGHPEFDGGRNPTMEAPPLSSGRRKLVKIPLIQGANMVWLGEREPEMYGTTIAVEVASQFER
jgi:hypothetical protein